jgi:VWFA-related protein
MNGSARWASMKIQVMVGVLALVEMTAMSAAAQVTGAPNSPSQTPYTLQVQTPVVLTDVTVTDKHGNPVTGLTEGDFRILDNGKPQKLESFEEHREQLAKLVEPSATPGNFSNEYLRHPPAQVNVILFDTTTIGVADQMYLFQQMKLFVDNLPAGEPVAVFTRRGDVAVELAAFTDDHEALMRAIKRAIPRLQQPGAWMASDLDTLQQMALYLNQVPGRKNLLWFTGGSRLFLGLNPMMISMDPAARRALYDVLEAERIAIYPIDARGLTVVFGRAAEAVALQQMQMRQDAEATGGTAYVNTNGLALTAQHILGTDGNYYTLTYSPHDLKNDAAWHRVEVKLARKDYRLSYRHGYFDDRSNRPGAAGITRTVLRPGGNKVEVPNDHGEPVVFNVEITPAPATPAPGDPPLKRGQMRYVVKYDVPAQEVFAAKGKVAGEVGTAELGTAVWAFNDDGAPVARNARKVTLGVDEGKAKTVRNPTVIFTQTINLPQGRNYLYLALWDALTGRMGTVDAVVEVKKPGAAGEGGQGR